MDGALDDGFTSEGLFNRGYSYTYDDVIFLPHYIDFPTDAVQLNTKLSRNINLSIPCVASPMDTVTESSMAVGMASIGGIGIIHSNNSPSDQATHIRYAKSRRIPFVSDPIFMSPSGSIASIDEFAASPCILVTESGRATSKLLGYVAKSDWVNLSDKETRISDYMVNSPVTVPANFDFDRVAGVLAAEKCDFLTTMNDGEVVDVVTRGDVERIKGFPKLGVLSVGANGDFLVGAAIGTREQDKERLEHLVKTGANVVVLDSSQGNSIYEIDMIKYVKRTYPELDVLGGNVVTAYQAQNLIQAGVDGLRVGMGSSSICTTQEVCSVGRGHVASIADGGISNSGHIAKALVLGHLL